MKKSLIVFLILASLLLCVPIASGQRRRHKRTFWRRHSLSFVSGGIVLLLIMSRARL